MGPKKRQSKNKSIENPKETTSKKSLKLNTEIKMPC